MSLINQMLRDLETRRPTPAVAGGSAAILALEAERSADAGAPVPSVHDSVHGRGSQRWLIATTVLLAVLLGLLLWSSQPPWQADGRVVATSSVATPLASVPVAQMTVEPVTPVDDTPAEPVVAPSPAVTEKVAAEPPSRFVVAEPPVSPPPVLSPEPPALSLESSVTTPQPEAASKPSPPAVPVQAPVADTLVSKRIRPLSDQQRAEQTLRRGVDLLEHGRHAEAELALQEALKLDPRQRRARETLAALYLNNGRRSETQALLADGLQLSPRAAGLAQLYARLLAEQDDLATALVTLLRARPPMAENPDYHALLAALLQRAGQHAQAVQTYRELLALRGTAAPWWMGLAISLEAQGETTPALEAYVKAHQLGAGLNPQVLEYLGGRIRALAPRVAAARAAAEQAKNEE